MRKRQVKKEGRRMTVKDEKGNDKIVRQMTRVKGKMKKLIEW